MGDDAHNETSEVNLKGVLPGKPKIQPELSVCQAKVGSRQRLVLKIPDSTEALLQLGHKGDNENGFAAGISAVTKNDVLIDSWNSTVTVAGKKQVLLGSSEDNLFAVAKQAAMVAGGDSAGLVSSGGTFIGGGVDWNQEPVDHKADGPPTQKFTAMRKAVAKSSEAASSAHSAASTAAGVVMATNAGVGDWASIASLLKSGYTIYSGAMGLAGGPHVPSVGIHGEDSVGITAGNYINAYGPAGVYCVSDKSAMLAAGFSAKVTGGAFADVVSAGKTTVGGSAVALVVSLNRAELASRLGTAEVLGEEIEVGSTKAIPPQTATNDVNVEAKQKVAIESENYIDIGAHNYVNIIVGEYKVQVHKDRGVVISDKSGDTKYAVTTDKEFKTDHKGIGFISSQNRARMGYLKSTGEPYITCQKSGKKVSVGAQKVKVDGTKLELG